jgi:hypothetical protein
MRLLLISSALLAVLPLPMSAQTGHPDLQGFWTNSTLTPLERPRDLTGKAVFTEKEAADYERRVLAAVNTDNRDANPEIDVGRSYNELFRERGRVVPDRRTSLIIDPPDGRIPALAPAGQKKAKVRTASADNPEDRNLAERCITRGAPKIAGGYNNNFQILQMPGYVVITQEMIHEARIISLDRKTHLDPRIHLWMGDSIGHWEGKTLVVETTNFDDRIAANSFNCCGLSGQNLKITERFTRASADQIDYQYTVDDPVIYTRPWTVSLPLTKIDVPIYEYACHEGNIALQGILAGARAMEKTAAPKSQR